MPVTAPANQGRWTSLWVVALVSLAAQLWICQFFSFGQRVPVSIDINPSNLWKFQYHFPPTGSFQVLNWLGVAYLPQPLNPFTLATHFAPWFFFTAYAPIMATFALLAMVAFLRELDVSRPAALFGGVIYAWQGDLLPFVFPGHFFYITTWSFFAIAAWGVLRAQRTRGWPYAVLSGAACGLMVQLVPDRGAIASLLIAALFVAPMLRRLFARVPVRENLVDLRHLVLCVVVALMISLAAFLALFQSNIVGVKLGAETNRIDTYKYVTQFSLGPAETLTYLVPGFFGWHGSSREGPYWGWIGESLDWPKHHEGRRNLNLAISTTGTIATILALAGTVILLSDSLLGPGRLTERQRFTGLVLLILGSIALVLSWGWHTPFYRPLMALPLMDKWRNPLKWLEVTNFSLVVLSAYGAQHFIDSLDTEALVVRRRLAWFIGGMMVLLGLGLLATYPFAIVLATALQGEGYDTLAIANIMSTLHTSLGVSLFLVTLCYFLLYALWNPENLRGFTLENPWLNRLWHGMLRPDSLAMTLALGLIVLSAIQLGWVDEQFVQPTDLSAVTATNPLLEDLKSEQFPAAPPTRVSVATEDPLLNILLLNQFNTDGISCMDISAASRYPDDISAFFFGPLNANRQRMYFLAGVKNIVIPQQYMAQLKANPALTANVDHVNGYTLEEPSGPDLPSHALVVLRDYLAKATLVPAAEFLPSDDATLKRLADPAWDPRASVLLDPKYQGQLPAKAATGSKPDSVTVTGYTPTEIDVQVSSAQGGYLLINDQYDPDWRVLVNGGDAELLRADYIMRAVVVPPGDSTVIMRYVARYHLGDMMGPWFHRHFGALALNARLVNNFSDFAMLAAWLVAGYALWWRSGLER